MARPKTNKGTSLALVLLDDLSDEGLDKFIDRVVEIIDAQEEAKKRGKKTTS